ncbi:MAG: hypothetical protein Q8907_09060 [Bacteroidota bacterium]|nr:hypothetical protein [Bacteroidota bacterium]
MEPKMVSSFNTNSLNGFIDRLMKLFNKVNPFILIFVLICATFLSFNIHPDEEHYFALAKQFIDPNWIPHSFLFSEWPGERFIFQYIVGPLLNYLSFEQFAFWGMLVCALLFAFPLAEIFKLLKISNVEILFLFQIIFFSSQNHQVNQSFFGGESIFAAVEPKTFAYILIFFALFFLLKEKYWQFVLFSVLATYNHFLAGGWFFLVACCYIFIYTRDFKKFFLNGLIYFLAVLPYIIYLYNGTKSIAPQMHGIKYDWLITYFGNPHHATLFKDKEVFMKDILPRVLIMFSCFLICVSLFSKIKDEYIHKLNILNILIFSVLTIFLLVGFFDKTGLILKLLPYRIASIGLLLTWIELFLYLNYSILTKEMGFDILKIAFILALPLLLYSIARKAYSIPRPIESTVEMDALCNYVDVNTRPTDVFAFVGFGNKVYSLDRDFENSFCRRARRDRFVVYRFIPYNNKIYEWYYRLKEMEKILRDPIYIFESIKRFKIDYLVSDKELCGFSPYKVYQNKTYVLYKLPKIVR